MNRTKQRVGFLAIVTALSVVACAPIMRYPEAAPSLTVSPDGWVSVVQPGWLSVDLPGRPDVSVEPFGDGEPIAKHLGVFARGIDIKVYYFEATYGFTGGRADLTNEVVSAAVQGGHLLRRTDAPVGAFQRTDLEIQFAPSTSANPSRFPLRTRVALALSESRMILVIVSRAEGAPEGDTERILRSFVAL